MRVGHVGHVHVVEPGGGHQARVSAAGVGVIRTSPERRRGLVIGETVRVADHRKAQDAARPEDPMAGSQHGRARPPVNTGHRNSSPRKALIAERKRTCGRSDNVTRNPVASQATGCDPQPLPRNVAEHDPGPSDRGHVDAGPPGTGADVQQKPPGAPGRDAGPCHLPALGSCSSSLHSHNRSPALLLGAWPPARRPDTARCAPPSHP